MNTPVLETGRLILRQFREEDLEALFLILKDEEVNKFLPWYPMKNHAICLKSDNIPIGYINVDMEEHHDFGYGIRKEYWHKGIATEAGRAVIERVKKDGMPYITATHDRNNPRNGMIMQVCGMKYCYIYDEQWQPKDFPVFFRMYQLNFDGSEDLIYKKYWDMYHNHFVEELD